MSWSNQDVGIKSKAEGVGMKTDRNVYQQLLQKGDFIGLRVLWGDSDEETWS